MSYKILPALLVAIVFTSSCGIKFTHYDLPNNYLKFTSEGGSVEYRASPTLPLDLRSISVECEKIIYKNAIFDEESNFIGYAYKWVKFIYGKEMGLERYIYVIEVEPNNSAEPRTAEISVRVSAKSYGELYISQEGKK